MNRIYTVETSAVIHHIDLAKIADIRHEPRGNRATVFFSGGSEVVVLFKSSEELDRFVAARRAMFEG